MTLLTKTCLRCHGEFTVEKQNDFDYGAMMRRYCDPCGPIVDEENRVLLLEREQKQKEAKWNEVCPPIYRNTDLTHEGLSPTLREASMGWDPFGLIGLGFMGHSGAGKTRLLFHCLRKAFDADLGVRYITHNAFSKLVIDAFSSGSHQSKEESVRSLSYLGKVRVLLFDDLGKAPSTERCDAELEELIEVRGSHLLPTLWSANGCGEWLVKRFGADRGEPLVRRLAEFSTVVKP